MSTPKIHLVSLGCPKNLVDSETVLGLLSNMGAQVVEEPEAADAIVVNTCAFIQSAVEESIEYILELAELKKTGQVKAMAVFGCLPQRYRNELSEVLPEVNLFWGTCDLDRLPEAVMSLLETPDPGKTPTMCQGTERPGFAPANPLPRLRSAPFYRAYLKIAEGCDNNCSYCLIPSLRGPLRSRPLEILVEEAAGLAENGVRELIVVAQDTTAYGRDMGNGTDLTLLLQQLADLRGFDWIRIMYAYPSGIKPELLELMAGHAKILPYLDLPLQHVSPGVLKNMRRGGPRDLLKLLDRIRNVVPDIILRTTLMVGFPGETQADFDQLLDFVQKARFNHLGVFKFFAEDGVPAAKYPDQVPQKVKEIRRRKIMAAQRRISASLNRRLVGSTVPVLVEGPSSETDLLLSGRTRGQAPDIDGQVYINKGTATTGDIMPVLITESHDYDLVGEIIPPGGDQEETGSIE